MRNIRVNHLIKPFFLVAFILSGASIPIFAQLAPMSTSADAKAASDSPKVASGPVQSREDLFRRAFGTALPVVKQTDKMTLIADDQTLGKLVVNTQSFDSEVEFYTEELCSLLAKVQTDEGIKAVIAIQDAGGTIRSEALKALGYTLKLSKAKSFIRLETPFKTRKINIVNVSRGGVGQKTIYPPAILSGFVNFQGTHFIDHDVPNTFFTDGYHMDGVLNFRENLLRFRGDSVYYPDPLNIKVARSGWIWSRIAAIRNDYKTNTQMIFGDTVEPGTNYLGDINLWGVGIASVDFRNLRGTNRLASKDVSFYLDKDADVDILVDHVPYRAYRLRAGNQEFHNIPIAEGVHQIDIVVQYVGSTEKKIQLTQTIAFDTGLLPMGESDFSSRIGIPTEVTQNTKLFYNNRLQSSTFYKLGVSDDLMVGGFFNGGQDQYNVGVDMRNALPVGIFRSSVAMGHTAGGLDIGVMAILTGYRLPEPSNELIVKWETNAEYFGPNFYNLNRWDIYRTKLAATVTVRPWLNCNVDLFASNQINYRNVAQTRLGVINRTEFDPYTNSQLGLSVSEDNGQTIQEINIGFFHKPNKANWNINANARLRSDQSDFTVAFKWAFTDTPHEIELLADSRASGGRYTFQDPQRNIRAGVEARSGEQSLVGVDFQSQSSDNNVYGSSQIIRKLSTTSKLDTVTYRGSRMDMEYRYMDTFAAKNGPNVRNSVVNYGVGLAFANGVLALSSPIRNSFAIINPHKTLANKKVVVNNNLHSDGLGPLVLHNLSPYTENRIFLDVPDADIWQDLGQQSYTVNPVDYSAYLIDLGSSGAKMIMMALVDPKGKKISLERAVMTGEDTPEPMPAKEILTGRSGDFVVTGLSPGTYRIRFANALYGNVVISIPDEAPGILNLGKIILGKEEITIETPLSH